jgi:hypothetical protein
VVVLVVVVGITDMKKILTVKYKYVWLSDNFPSRGLWHTKHMMS